MRVGLTFDEYFDLKLKPRAGADPAFHEAAEHERDAMFLMTTEVAANHLRSRGYDARPRMLELLWEKGTVGEDPDAEGWSRQDVDAAADHFEECGIWTPYAQMCNTLGCSYADWCRALRQSAESESRKYGRRLPEDDQYYVMHRFPPRGDAPTKIWFTLADDIRERIERGEEV